MIAKMKDNKLFKKKWLNFKEEEQRLIKKDLHFLMVLQMKIKKRNNPNLY